MEQYLDLLSHVIQNGTRKENRTGVDTISTFGYFYEHDFDDGFPLLTTKKMPWKSIVVELLWFLSGSNDIAFLHRHGVNFWDPWINSDGTVNSPYNSAWRRFETPNGNIDQIQWAIDKLKSKPMSRDIVVSAWQPHIAHNPPSETVYWNPCHTMFVLNVQNVCKEQRLCLQLLQRSADSFVGAPFNLASYALLNCIFAKIVGMKPGIFAHSIVDAHLYTCKEDGTMDDYDHVPLALEQIKRRPLLLPRIVIDNSIKSLDDVVALLNPNVTTEEILSKFKLVNYKYHPPIKAKVAV